MCMYMHTDMYVRMVDSYMCKCILDSSVRWGCVFVCVCVCVVSVAVDVSNCCFGANSSQGFYTLTNGISIMPI